MDGGFIRLPFSPIEALEFVSRLELSGAMIRINSRIFGFVWNCTREMDSLEW